MAYTKIITLIEKLHERTIARKLDWEKTTGDSLFQCAFSNYIVLIESRENRNSSDETDYEFSIINQDGAIIEQVDDEELRREYQIEGYRLLREIHDVARRVALGTEAAIDSLLDELS